MQYAIKRSVGDWHKGAVNLKADVRTVQTMLTQAAQAGNEPTWNPKGLDGLIAHTASKSNTVAAIKAFQSGFMPAADGLIEVNSVSWTRLLDAALGASTAAQPANQGGPFFPFPILPKKNWTESPRKFGANREHGKRAHAGSDLYFPTSTVMYAIADGVVLKDPYDFYLETYALEIDHGSFIARYGEVQEETFVKAGDQVRAGQKIARVGQLKGLDISMLHLELYDKTYKGELTQKDPKKSKSRADGVSFSRRKDLIDATPYLNQWQHNLPSAY